MNPLDIFGVLRDLAVTTFKRPPAKRKPSPHAWVGAHFLDNAKKHFAEEPSKINEGARCLDQAIACGLENAEVFGLRATALQELEYHADAIEDFSRQIEFAPRDCNTYFQRSISKSAIGDLAGSAADLEEAVRLSRAKTKINDAYHLWAQKTGYRDVTEMFESELNRIRNQLNHPSKVLLQCLEGQQKTASERRWNPSKELPFSSPH